MPNDTVSVTINDSTTDPKTGSPERTTFKLFTAPISSANIDTIETQVGTLTTALAGVCRGVIFRTNTQITEQNPDVVSSDPLAQRENKWRVVMVGGGEIRRFTIGTADLTLLEAGTENMADNAQRTALITALENLMKASDGVTAMTVQLPIRFVSTNS